MDIVLTEREIQEAVAKYVFDKIGRSCDEPEEVIMEITDFPEGFEDTKFNLTASISLL